MSRIVCVALILTIFVSSISSAPAGPNDETKSCYDEVCPPRTTGCKKISKTTEDKKLLDVTVVCMDIQDYEMQKFNKQIPNPYGPNTHYESTSFTGTYSYSGSGGNLNLKPINIFHNTYLGNGNSNDVEDFS